MDSDRVLALTAVRDIYAPNGDSSLVVSVYSIHCVMTVGVLGGKVLHEHMRDEIKSFSGSKSLCILVGSMSLGILLKMGALVPDTMRMDVRGEIAIVCPVSAA